MQNLSRLLNPQSIAVIGGGAWCNSIVLAARQIGFEGILRPIHPSGKTIAGIASLTSLEEFSGPIDAAFIGINRHATLDIVAQLRSLGAGGAICFASGFSEAVVEDATGSNLQTQLITAAGNMPILGPNCYGFLNAFDGCGIWPDQHGCRKIDRGVAILTQSSNIAINLTMQNRGLPIGYVITCGNQAQTSQSDVGLYLLDDPRVSAIGLHVEGFGDLRGWETLARKAHDKNIPLIALKLGKTEQAQAAAVSHTASLSGSDAGAQALLERLGIRRAHSLPVFLEALKLSHQFGQLTSNRIASISCSGGEAALTADTAHTTKLTFPPLNSHQRTGLSTALGPMVALANPLDYHTYIWRNEALMAQAWAAMADPDIALTLLISDYPRADICDPRDWDCVTNAAISAARQTKRPYAVVASLGELMPEHIAKTLMANGVAAINGLDHGIQAIDLLTRELTKDLNPIILPGVDRDAKLIDEHAAKQNLAHHGLSVPRGVTVLDRTEAAKAATTIGFPVALKALGLAHKTGSNGLILDIKSSEEVNAALLNLAPGRVLIEQMIVGTVTELLVGVIRDPAHGFVLTIAAGGTMTELLSDRANLLVPASRKHLTTALNSLRIAPLFHGYRGKPHINFDALLDAIDALQSYVLANASSLEEVEINPLICTAQTAIAVDALIRKTQ